MKPHASQTRTATAPLLYWLLVVCGLAGLTVQHLDAPAEVLPLWLGTVVGVGLGQLVAWLRVRAWVLASIAMAALWLSPVFFFVLYNSIRTPVETCAFAFIPAAICGYLSLSERGGLVAFWYPAVLWMLVILDGPQSSAFDARAALPLVVGLTALFVAFLRARESRRVALWHAHASVRLATPLPRAVLQASPLRAASQHVWTGLVGATALVLAAWIAPHLWQREQAKHASIAAAQSAGQSFGSDAIEDTPCCYDSERDENRSRVREYFPLFRGQDEAERRSMTASCAVCPDGKRAASASGLASGGSYDGRAAASSGYNSGGDLTVTPPSTGPATTPADWVPSLMHAAPPVPADLPPPTVEPKHAIAPSPKSAPTIPAAVPPPPVPPTPTTTTTPTQVAAAKPAVVVVFVPKSAAAPPPETAPPWRSVLALCFGGLALHVLVRALRRQLTLRHLARPFWRETLDQRISNHWQRLLIGLRDAGIHPKRDEQPEALAKRVGLEGMATCATILERVRHGVRVDAEDLDAMDAAAGTTYRAARAKAGVSGRAAALLRWPLA